MVGDNYYSERIACAVFLIETANRDKVCRPNISRQNSSIRHCMDGDAMLFAIPPLFMLFCTGSLSVRERERHERGNYIRTWPVPHECTSHLHRSVSCSLFLAYLYIESYGTGMALYRHTYIALA